MSNTYPIQDGQVIKTRYGVEKVMGEITPPHKEPVCWTLQGNWYRRKDGEEMTGACGQVMTVRRFFELRRQRKT